MSGSGLKSNAELEGELIAQVSKRGREFLYDLGNKDYRNNCLKLKIWGEIGIVLGLSKEECQKTWKNLKLKYKAAIRNQKPKSGSSAKKIKPYTEWLIKEMEFLHPFISDSEPTTSNFQSESSSSFQQLFDEMANDADVMDIPQNVPSSSTPLSSTSAEGKNTKKRKLLESSEDKISAYIDKMEYLEKCITDTEEMDPFILMVDKEIKKVAEHKINSLKIEILQAIYNAQK